MVTICHSLPLNEYFSPKLTQDDPLGTLDRCLVQGVYKFNIFFKWPLQKIMNIKQKL